MRLPLTGSGRRDSHEPAETSIPISLGDSTSTNPAPLRARNSAYWQVTTDPGGSTQIATGAKDATQITTSLEDSTQATGSEGSTQVHDAYDEKDETANDAPTSDESLEAVEPEKNSEGLIGVSPVQQPVENEKVKESNEETLVRTTSTATNDTDENEVGAAEDESKYPKAFPLAILTFGLCMATFVVALDNTIIATAIPKITTVFDSLNDVGWYGSSYLLTTTSLQPSFGKVYTYFNIKWTYIFALGLFEVGSILCATAQSSTMLIVGRAVAGAGAAALFSGGMTIIGFAVPLRKRAIYIALLSSMFGISSVIGPLLGGAFTDRVSWRWCFWINLPFGAIAIATVFFFFKNPDRKHSNLTTKQKIGQIDLLGAFFLICAIVCLLLALQWGGTVYPWHDSKVWGCLLGFGLIIIIFILLQLRLGERATIPPRILLKQRTVLACALFSMFLSMGLYTHIFYLPFYFQAVKGTSAEGSGIRTIPYLISITLSSIAVGGAITAFGPYTPFTWAGSAIFAVGAGMIYTLKVNSGAGMWIGYQILAGIGAGACVQIPFIAVQVVLNKKDMPSGNAVTIFFNSLGGAISISIAQNIFSNTLIKQIPKYTHGVDPATIIAAGATHIRQVTPPDQLIGVLTAYNIAVTHSYILAIASSVIAFLLSFLFEWKSVKGKNLMAGAAA